MFAAIQPYTTIRSPSLLLMVSTPEIHGLPEGWKAELAQMAYTKRPVYHEVTT